MLRLCERGKVAKYSQARSVFLAVHAALYDKKVSMEGISITKLLVIAVLVILLFGTSKLRTLGADLGAALKGFKKPWVTTARRRPPAATLPRASPLSRASRRKTFNPV